MNRENTLTPVLQWDYFHEKVKGVLCSLSRFKG